MSKMLQVNQFNEKEFWEGFRKELEEDQKYIEQERKESFDKLLVALNYFKGHEVMIDSWNGLMMYKPINNFDYSLKQNRDKEMFLDFDNEDEEFTSGLALKLDDIQSIYIDDNTEYIESGQMTEYEVQDIVITLWNDSILRIELQW